MTTPVISHGVLTAGTTGIMTCNYTLPSFVDASVIATANWTVNGTSLASNDRVMIDGLTLTIFPLTLSDSGSYECTLILTALSPHLMVMPPQQSSEIFITIFSQSTLSLVLA